MAFAEDYVPVADRIIAFRLKHPEGSLRPADPTEPFRLIDVDGKVFIAYTAAAFRAPDDPAPGIGCAWEPVPGLTNFTRNSELQNAESSAWGRAIIAVGAADAKRGIASAEDVEHRQAEAQWLSEQEAAVPGLRSSIEGAIGKLADDQKQALKDWFAERRLPAVRRMNAAQCDQVLEHLMALPTVESGGAGDREAPDATPGVAPSPDSSTEAAA